MGGEKGTPETRCFLPASTAFLRFPTIQHPIAGKHPALKLNKDIKD